MNRFAPLFLFALLPATSTGEVPAPSSQPSRLTAIIRASTPGFAPPPPTPTAPAPPAPAATESPEADPDVVTLPKFFVVDGKLPRFDRDKLLSQRELAAKMRRDYRASLTELEWALNGFSIPFLTPSVAARAQAKYENDRRTAEQARLGNLLDVAARLDPKAAAELRRELERR